MIRIAIAEDSAPERAQLQRYLERFGRENHCAFAIEIYENGMDILTNYRPGVDLLLLDIEMPVMDGMRAAKSLRERDRQVSIVFITNLAQYAIQGYEVEALDFIVKPLDWPTFSFRMKRIVSRLRKHQDDAAAFVCVKTERGIQRVDAVNILYIEVNLHLLLYHTTQGILMERGTMRDAEKPLLNHWFCRCHQCYLVNLKYVTEIRDDVICVGGEELRISRSRKKEIVRALTEYMAANQ